MRADRGLHSPVPRAVLVDSPTLQGPPCAAAGSLCRADSVKARSRIEAREVSRTELSLAPFWGPRYWPTWALLGVHARRRQAAALVATRSRALVRPPAAALQETRRARRAAQHRALLPRLERRRAAASCSTGISKPSACRSSRWASAGSRRSSGCSNESSIHGREHLERALARRARRAVGWRRTSRRSRSASPCSRRSRRE